MRYASILCALTEGRGGDALTRPGRSDALTDEPLRAIEARAGLNPLV